MSIPRSRSPLSSVKREYSGQGEAGCRVSHSQTRGLHPHLALWSPVSPKSVRTDCASFSLPPAVPVPGAFEHPGCRKKEGISERLHWVRKNARGWERCGCFTEGGSEEN